jgi:plastocyanin
MRTLLLGSALLLALLVPLAASAANVRVDVGGNGLAFFPQTLTIQAGDTVTFVNIGGFHNMVADNGAFRCARGCDNDGAGGSGNPSGTLWRATVAFPNRGRFGYFCEPHGAPGQGMFGTIIVQQAPAPLPVPAAGLVAGAILAVMLVIGVALRMRLR